MHRRGLNLQDIQSKEDSVDINGGKTSICLKLVSLISWKLIAGIIDNFMPSRDAIKLIPIANFVTNRKTTEIRRQFLPHRSIDNREKTQKCNRNSLMKEIF